MMASYKTTLELLRVAKEHGLVTFLGGHHATQLCNEIMLKRHMILDYIIVGDGEEAFYELVTENSDLSRIPNLVFFKSGKVVHTFESNVDLKFGIIDYINPKVIDQYRRDIGLSLEREEKLISFRAYSHKGCSNRLQSQYCFFCGRADRGVRFKKPEEYVKELAYLSNIPTAKYIFEIGDDFLQDIDWLNEVVALRNKSNIDESVHLKIFARANRITREVIPILKKLNVDEVAIGFESGSEKVLRNINKNATPSDNLVAAKLLFQEGIDTIASFVLGLPGEDEESLGLTYEAAKSVQELALRYLGRLPQEIIANLIEVNPGAPAFRKLRNYMPLKYKENDMFSVHETQNDYFRMQFGLRTDEELSDFRRLMSFWGNKINDLGKYTYPAGWQVGELL